jgi:hypothetical protein
MDCLRHYCIQFDFTRNKMRFLDPAAPAGGGFGRRIPLMIIGGLVIARADCFGTGKIFFCPDTGCQACDAMLKPKLVRRLEKKQKSSWSTTFTVANNDPKIAAGLPTGAFAGESYSDLTVMEWYGSWPDGELVGLPFFARNLVTFDFPERTMYLRKKNSMPLNPVFFEEEAGTYLKTLFKKGELPGWATNETGSGTASNFPNTFTNYPISLTFDIHKGLPSGWADVSARVKSLAHRGACQIVANNNLLGWDPAPNRVKKLQVSLRVNGHRKTVETIEGKTLALPAHADVLQARYGDLSGQRVEPKPGNYGSLIYHYTLVQEVHDGPWKLQKAWLTDKKGPLIKDYPVPKAHGATVAGHRHVEGPEKAK